MADRTPAEIVAALRAEAKGALALALSNANKIVFATQTAREHANRAILFNDAASLIESLSTDVADANRELYHMRGIGG